MKKENRAIASLSGLGIILVVLGHSGGVLPHVAKTIVEVDLLYRYFMELKKWIYTFHMPLFFFISGFLFFYSTLRKYNYKEIALRKFKRLIVPYLVISFIAYPVKVLLSQFALRPIHFSLNDIFRNIFIPWDNTIFFFWFLPTLFLVFLLSAIFLKEQKNSFYDLMLTIVATIFWFIFPHLNTDGVLSFFNIGGALHNIIFFIMGFVFCKYKIYKTKHINTLGLFSFVLSIVLFNNQNGLPLEDFILSVLGLIFCYWLCSFSWSECLARMGDFSYQIYLFSWFPQVVVRIILGQVFFINIWFSVLSSFILGLFIPIVITLFLDAKAPVKFKMIYGR